MSAKIADPVAFLGIDVSKDKLDLGLLRDGKVKSKVVKNNLIGFEELSQWLVKQGVKAGDKGHACLESTGTYGEAISLYLADRGHIVSVVNPMRIKAFGISMMQRTKTDKNDARIIARFCELMKPAAWAPPSSEMRELQALVRRLHVLQEMAVSEQNRLDVAPEGLKADIETHITYLCQEITKVEGIIRW